MTDPYGSSVYRRNRRIVLSCADGRCSVVGCSRRATTCDHIVPLARGGGHDLANLRAMCWYHNSQGGADITNLLRRAKRIGRQSRRW